MEIWHNYQKEAIDSLWSLIVRTEASFLFYSTTWLSRLGWEAAGHEHWDALSAVPPYVCSWWRVLQRKEQDVPAAAQLLGTNNGSRRPRLTRKTLAMHCSRTWNTHTVHWRPSSVKPRTTRTVVQRERYSLPRKPHVHERASCRPAPSRDPQGCVGPVPHRPVRNGPACCNACRTRYKLQYGAMT